MKNKVVFVKANFKPTGKVKTVKVPTGEKKKGFFGGMKNVLVKEEQWVQTGRSDCEIDGEKLAEDLQTAILDFNRNGYEVLSVSPVTSAQYDFKWKEHVGGQDHGGSGYGYGYGYSYTEGMVIIGKK